MSIRGWRFGLLSLGLLCVLLFSLDSSSAAGDVILLSSADEVMAATRGEGRFAGLQPGTTFRIRNGVYTTPANIKALLWIRAGGTQDAPRRFIGESRDGVIIAGRATVAADHVELRNMTFDLTDYTPPDDGSFGTVTIVNARHVRVSSVTCTGAGTKGKRGGHVELYLPKGGRVPEGIVIEDCLLEKFGRFGESDGKLDHGVYISAGRDRRPRAPRAGTASPSPGTAAVSSASESRNQARRLSTVLRTPDIPAPWPRRRDTRIRA